ncbi:unnamed protein product [Symbiodinium sp. CCMP2592]|nr:unnamed protein product [Symbiodinium sp. CCMP2592]
MRGCSARSEAHHPSGLQILPRGVRAWAVMELASTTSGKGVLTHRSLTRGPVPFELEMKLEGAPEKMQHKVAAVANCEHGMTQHIVQNGDFKATPPRRLRSTGHHGMLRKSTTISCQEEL